MSDKLAVVDQDARQRVGTCLVLGCVVHGT